MSIHLLYPNLFVVDPEKRVPCSSKTSMCLGNFCFLLLIVSWRTSSDDCMLSAVRERFWPRLSLLEDRRKELTNLRDEKDMHL